MVFLFFLVSYTTNNNDDDNDDDNNDDNNKTYLRPHPIHRSEGFVRHNNVLVLIDIHRSEGLVRHNDVLDLILIDIHRTEGFVRHDDILRKQRTRRVSSGGGSGGSSISRCEHYCNRLLAFWQIFVCKEFKKRFVMQEMISELG